MATSAQSKANQVPRTPPPSPELRCLTHQPSLSLEPLGRLLRGLVVQHAEGVGDRIESNRVAEPTGEIIQDKSSNRKTFLDQKADGFVFDGERWPLGTINHDMVKHEDT